MARRGTYAIVSIIRLIGLIIVAFLVVFILFVVFNANLENSFAHFVESGAKLFSLGLRDLFLFPANPKLQTGVNYGIAAVIWLVITNIVTGLVRRVG